MIMEPFEVYRYYLALRLHFTTDRYDVIQQRGKVRASKNAFLRRTDLLAIRRIAETYSDKDVVNFLIANFVSGDRWGGVFDTEAKERFTGWKKRMESLSYTFQREVEKIISYSMKTNISFHNTLKATKDEHPYIIKMYLRNDISIETLVILNQLEDFVANLDLVLKNDLVWPDVSRIIKKYTPFIEIDKEKYDRILRRAIGSN